MPRIGLQIWLVLCLFVVLSLAAKAATFTVNQSGDAGDGTCDATCTLRDAIDDANNAASNDTIDFAAGLTTIALTSEIVIQNNGTLDINGLGANVLTIDVGAGPWRVFYTNGATVAITDVTLTGGNGSGSIVSGNGGAILASGGSLTLDRVHLTGNTTATADFGGGGVAYNGGTHVIRNSTLSGNNGVGGGIYVVVGTLTVSNSTISGNASSSSFAGGGGVYTGQGNITLRNVTITNNTAAASTGGGMYIGAGGLASINFGNTIVAGNTAAGGQPDIYFGTFGTITSAGNNQVGDSPGDAADTSTPVTYQGSDILDVPTELIALGLYGGTTPVHPLQFSSPTRDAGSDTMATGAGLTTDQRGTGFPRIVDTSGGDNDVDIGAFEYSFPTAASVSVSGLVLSPNGRGVPKAMVTLTSSDGQTRAVLSNGFGYFSFEEVMVGQTYFLHVSSKRYQFTPLLVTVTDEITNLNLTAQESTHFK